MVFWLWYVPSMCYEFILYTMVPDIFYLFSGVINSYFSSHGSHVSLCSDTACIWHWDMWWTLLLLFYFAIWNRTHNIWSNNAADQTHFKTRNTISAHLIQSLPISTMFRFYTFNSLMLVFTTVDRSLTSHPHQLNLWLLPIIQYDCSLYRCLFFCSLYKIYSIVYSKWLMKIVMQQPLKKWPFFSIALEKCAPLSKCINVSLWRRRLGPIMFLFWSKEYIYLIKYFMHQRVTFPAIRIIILTCTF